MPLDRITFPVGALGCNCTIVSCPETKEALVIDPGDEAPEILAALARAGLRAVKIVHTHAHFDHVMGTGEVAASTGAEVLLHRDDRWLYDNAAMQMSMFGLARARRGAAPVRDDRRRPRSSCAATRRSRSDATRSAPSTRPDTRRDPSASISRNPAQTPLLFAGDTLLQGVDRAHRFVGRFAAGHQTFHSRTSADPARTRHWSSPDTATKLPSLPSARTTRTWVDSRIDFF